MKTYLKPFFSFIKEDLQNKRIIFFFIFLTLLTTFNYKVDFEDSILDSYNNTFLGWLYYLLFYGGVFLTSVLILKETNQVKTVFTNRNFWLVTFGSFSILALYQAINPVRYFIKSNDYFTYKLTAQLDLVVIICLAILVLGVIIGKSKHKIYGLLQFKFDAKIYFIFLALMIPLLLWAATQPDFLAVYPKLKHSRISSEYLSKFLIYEPFYLFNFIGIEWLFRGFFILAFAQFFDKKSVILIAGIYCIFHFGKPLAECISSFFGGYLLGYMVYKTKTIWGGVIVHMGIAFLMDIFALLSILYF